MQKRRRWYWQQGNSVELLIDGQCYFPAMLDAINGASQSVLLEFYFVSSGQLLDRFIEAFQKAIERGVQIRMLVDGFGSRGLTSGDRQRIRGLGVRLKAYNPIRLTKWNRNFSRDHRKLMIVDGRIAFIGGTGLTDDFYVDVADSKQKMAWHELMLAVQGPILADWMALFQRQWRACSAEQIDFPVDAGIRGVAELKVATAEGIHQQEIKANFRSQINAAHRRVWLVTAYFLPSWSIRRALLRAARRGIDVRLLLPGPITDHPGIYYASRRYYKRLLAAGVRIYEYQPRFMHAKLGVCDNWVSIGSCNLDHWNLRWNLEANQEAFDAALVEQVCESIQHDFGYSDEITLEQWLKRPLHKRV
ncbi:MAG: phosphatidylserine/phosphatidylglycerophosphate/cardiolipin synthase family protein, partial [Motiliproteus sp.]|nr:phosphatidylserine/phosphatidylglycerophosphate/cardiolipin synthase family protein [Motiliproteus sp.]